MVFVVLPVVSVDQSHHFIFSKKVVHNGSVWSPPVSVPKCLCVVAWSRTADGGGAAWAARAEAGHRWCSRADKECRHPASVFFISLPLVSGQPRCERGDVNWVTSRSGGDFQSQAGVTSPSDQERGLHARCETGWCYTGERQTENDNLVVRYPGELRPSPSPLTSTPSTQSGRQYHHQTDKLKFIAELPFSGLITLCKFLWAFF